MIFALTLYLFWPTVLLVPTVAMIGFSVIFFLWNGKEGVHWADRVLLPVLAASVCSAIVSVSANLIVAQTVAALMGGVIGAFWIVIMLAVLSIIPVPKVAENG